MTLGEALAARAYRERMPEHLFVMLLGKFTAEELREPAAKGFLEPGGYWLGWF